MQRFRVYICQGRADYRGAEYTAKLVSQLIESYGDKLHLFAAQNPKYAHLLNDSDDTLN